MKKMLILFVALAFMGCKTVHYQRAEVLSRQNSISQLKDRLDQGIANDVDVLSPKHFEEAKGKLDQAIKEAEKSPDSSAGNETAEAGLREIEVAEGHAQKASIILEKALKGRAKAQEAQADIIFERDFDTLEKQLRYAGTHLEEGDEKYGIEKNAELAKKFGELEVKALKINISETAEKAYEEAKASDAHRLAPITLKSAKEELDVAKRILDIEKENYEKAQYHAERSRYLALQAKFIADLLTGFKKERLSDEQVILWYQSQLDKVHSPLPTDLQFDRSNRDVVLGFENELKRTISEYSHLESRALDAEKKNVNISEKLAESVTDKHGKASFEEAAKEEKFREITAMFSKDEAEVLKRGNDIIIRAYGFYFLVGKADLLPRNFSLLHKIVSAIVKFPKSQIEVEGHTDSTGSRNTNMRLSKKRADNISDFLVKIEGIDPNRIKSTGAGAERPIAENDTVEGREKNRRVEVIIKGN